MEGGKFEMVAEIGRELLTTKWYSTSMYCMWVYDYFLTLGDEVTYAWSGRKSWVFVLFITNRYIPVLHILYKGLIMFDFTIPLWVSYAFTRYTKWEVNLYTLIVAFLAQTTIALRLYAVTGGSKLQSGLLCVLILVQLVGGLWFTIVTGIRPMQLLPQVNLDAYKVCFFQQWRPGEFSFIVIALTFDISALFMILYAARGSILEGCPGVPSLLRKILQDATIYFLLMFVCQLLLLFFLFLAPVQVQLLPWITHSMFLPMMTCRLMLSLKKAAYEPSGSQYLSEADGERRTSETLEFAPLGFDASRGVSDTIIQPNEGDLELEFVTESPR